MTNRTHDHTTFGLRRGCVACAQVEADIAASSRHIAKQMDTAVGDSLYEAAMNGEAWAIPAYAKWVERERIYLSEGGAGLLLSTPG